MSMKERRKFHNKKYREEFISSYTHSLQPCLFNYLDYWATRKPSNEIFIYEYETMINVTWKIFQKESKMYALKMLNMGLRKGDVIGISLMFVKELSYIIMGGMRIGVIVAPMDIRLKSREINKLLEKIKPKMYFFHGKTEKVDFCPIVKEVMKKHGKENGGTIEHFVQFQNDEEEDVLIEGAMDFKTFKRGMEMSYFINIVKEWFYGGLWYYESQVKKDDPAVIIFTTGSTGDSKAALLSHHNILSQTLSFQYGFLKDVADIVHPSETIILVNLPASHVGGLTELFLGSLFAGNKVVLLSVFDAEKSLDCIVKYKVNILAQIPACFNLQWRLKNYNDYDLSSLKVGLYAGSAVTKPFLQQLKKMCNHIFSGFGMTEVSGFGVYTTCVDPEDELINLLGWSAPSCDISIRTPMNKDRTAGKECKPGEVGEICFKGPQVFLGYYGEPEKTKKVLTKDKIYYTGDLGSYDIEKGGLLFKSRRKFVIKTKGYQVFPSEVADFIANIFKVQIQFIAIIGVEHAIYSQGIIAIIKLNDNQSLTKDEINSQCKNIAAYKRPSLIVFVDKFPLNRIGKPDYLACSKLGKELVEKERLNGGWDQ